jgi:DNA-binding NarL/FixJ family response regulator
MSTLRENTSARVVLFTDEPLLAFGVSAFLATVGWIELRVAPAEVAQLVPLVEQTRPDLLLLDLTSEMSLSLISALQNASPETRLVLWARYFSDEFMIQIRDMGIGGYILRTCSNGEFEERLRQVAEGRHACDTALPARSTKVQLSPRESQLVSLLAQGLKNKEIASCLELSENTVKAYLWRLFQKVGARDRFELALFGLKNASCGQASWDGHGGFVTEPEGDRARPILRSLVLVEPSRRTGYPELARAESNG